MSSRLRASRAPGPQTSCPASIRGVAYKKRKVCIIAFDKIKKWGSKHHNGLLVAGGFVLGTAGVKAVTSQTAKKGYVKVVASGIRAKNAYLDICEQAKAEVDDIVAEASYITTEDAAKANA